MKKDMERHRRGSWRREDQGELEIKVTGVEDGAGGN